MKSLVLLNIFLISVNLFNAESYKDCYEFMNFDENKYFNDTNRLKNGAILYYKWNCDSTWLTFEYKNKQIILKSCTNFDPILCSQLGLSFIKEYPNYLLFKEEWISGCCTPPDMVFINKDTGTELNRITNDLFLWGDADENYILYFSDTTYCNLIYLDNNSNNEYLLQFENDQINNSARLNQVTQLANLFNNFKKTENEFSFDFKTSKGEVKKMEIKLKK